MGLKIIPLSLGMIQGVNQVTYPFGFKKEYETAAIVFLILGGEHPVLVDTGPPNKEITKKNLMYDLITKEDETIERQLQKHHVSPNDIKTVILTHLHWDHCYNTELFSNATFYVQRREVAYAVEPLEIHRIAYDKRPGYLPQWLNIWDRLICIDGEYELTENINLIPLPGHTPGLQGVEVTCEKERYILAGDCVFMYSNWTGNKYMKHLVGGVHVDLTEYYNSFKKLEKFESKGYEIVPGHDPLVLEKSVFI